MRGSRGQAAAEFAVAAVALLAAAVGIFAVAELVRADSDALAAARAAAAEASHGNAAESSVRIVRSVSAGADGIFLSPDDTRQTGGVDVARDGVARPLLLGGSVDAVGQLVSEVPGGGANQLSQLVDGGLGSSARAYAMRKGEGSAEANLPPAARSLFGLPESAETRAESWMPGTGGLQ